MMLNIGGSLLLHQFMACFPKIVLKNQKQCVVWQILSQPNGELKTAMEWQKVQGVHYLSLSRI